MIKRYQFLLVLAVLSVAVTGFARGPFYSESIPARSSRKFTRGLLNTVFFWAEIPKEVNRDWQNVDPLTGVFTGTGKGIYKGAQRFGVGVYEMVTFPLDSPANYQPIVYPETVMEDGVDWGAEDYYIQQRSSKLY
ncbi:MAG: exosortase system-associated protein, TIGR04073 family [Candidatus Sumerlaeaceae bacterium]|nr:exosortase system-associated protein, TIGR04073 family [Candidatus Sumerlaeaceae bacterium]